MSEGSPIVKAQKMLAEADVKLKGAEQLRLIGKNLSWGTKPVELASDVLIKSFGINRSPEGYGVKNDLLRDAMKAGCEAHGAKLEHEARELAIEAGKLLAPPPVMRESRSFETDRVARRAEPVLQGLVAGD